MEIRELGSKIGEVAPFVVMVVMEGGTIGLTILAKTAMTGGLTSFVFVVYTNVVGTLLLLPFSVFFHWGQGVEQPLFTFPLLLRFCLMGFTGVALAQNLAFVGLSFSSPIVVCAMGLLIPTFSFILSILIRKTNFKWTSSSFRYKLIGSLITVAGAIVVIFYKGPFFKQDSSSNSPSKLLFKQHLFVFYSTPDRWVLGGLLLAASFLCVSIWNIIQLGTLKQYPQLQVMKVASLYSLAGTIQCAIFAFTVVRDFDAWKLNSKFDLLLILVTAIFGSLVRSSVQMCFGRKRGPFYVPLFQPFRIFWACFFGITFFANSLHYGSVIGTVICGVGFYTVMWGQMKESEKPQDNIEAKKPQLSDEKVPLLQDIDDQV